MFAIHMLQSIWLKHVLSEGHNRNNTLF